MVHEMSVKLGDGYKVDVEYKGFTIRTDQPVRDGGENTAPSPFDLFLASLGACAGFYALAFCRERKIPTAGLDIFLSFSRGAGSKLLDLVTIDVHLPAHFPEKYRGALSRAIDQCTVKAHLAKPPKIELLLKTSGE